MIVAIFIGAMLITALTVWFLQHSLTGNRLELANEMLKKESELVKTLTENLKRLQSDKELLIRQVSHAESQFKSASEQLDVAARYQKENKFIQEQLAMFKAKFHGAEDKLENQKKEMETLGNHFKFEFRNLAQSILEEKSEKFTQLHEEKMNAILTPLKAELGEFKKKVEETYDKESKERFSLGKEIEKLVQMSQLVSTEANNLTTALKGSSKMQGNWGEMILESLLEHSGLTKGREYVVQEFIRDNAGNVVKDEYGKGLQPDITIIYPDERKLIIDSKVSLRAWDQYVTCGEMESQKKCLDDHLRSIRLHIDGLSRKNYPRYALALDYVLMFIPIEPAFLEAVKADLQLWKYAYDRRILLVSATNLFAVLKIVADLWKVEQQNMHAIAIADKAGQLYDKFTLFVGNMESAGQKMKDANDAYAEAFKQLSTGRGNIIRQVEELKKMGANAQKQLPDKLLIQAGEE